MLVEQMLLERGGDGALARCAETGQPDGSAALGEKIAALIVGDDTCRKTPP